MKYVRTIATFLILVMVSSPVLAAICSISCAAGSLAASVTSPVDSIAGDLSAVTADHCHHGVADSSKHESSKQAPSKHQPNTEHKGCTMAGGCHFAQAAVASPVQLLSVNYTSVTYPHFTLSALCAELPPPIKPPA